MRLWHTILRGSALFLVLVLLVTPAVAVQATPGQAGDDEGPRTVDADQVPAFAALRPPSPTIRLHAQFADDDAYLTLREGQLAGGVTPSYDAADGARVVFAAFAPLTTQAGTDGRTYYGARAVEAGWESGFVPDVPVQAEWRMSLGRAEGLDAALRPMLVIDTALQAVDRDGHARILAADRTHVEPDLEQDTAVEVPVLLGDVPDTVRPGDRLEVTLDWHWVDAAGSLLVRPPLVTLHPGSWVDLPLEEPVRIDAVVERRVLDALFVRARVAHVFSAAHLDLEGTHVFMAGPSGNTVGGGPVRQVDADEQAEGRRAAVDWRMPVSPDNMLSGTYDIFVATRQVGEEAPRLIVHRPVHLEGAAVPVEPAWHTPWAVASVALAILAAAAVPAFFLSRRVMKTWAGAPAVRVGQEQDFDR